MDIELSTVSSLASTVFRPIDEFPTSQLYQQQVTIETSFFASPQHHQSSLLLTLIDNTLLLSDPNAQQVQPHSAVTLDFDLKFEVIYQTQVPFPSSRKMSFPQKSALDSSTALKTALVSFLPSSA